MKKIFTLLLLMCSTCMMWAQAPQEMSYQSVVRNANNELLSNTSVGMQISVLQGSANGNTVYVERHSPMTNSNGLLSLRIGSGAIVSGDFTSIDWSMGPYFILTQTDPNGGSSYSISGTSQMLSVPYAMYAEKSGSSESGPAGPTGPKGDTGDDGPAGQEGPKGDEGPAGLKGSKGDDGDEGSIGPMGSKGDDGDEGPVGLKGSKGDDGPIGPMGLKGNDGDEGPEGPVGPKGSKGDTGEDGLNGGMDGADGKEGPEGPKGDDGNVGPEGPEGPKGDDGDEGPRGLKGDVGNDGDDGNVGPEGPPGEDGKDGNGAVQDLSDSRSGTDVTIDISGGGDSTTFSVKDGDSDDTNEHQDLSMTATGNGDIQIDISEGNTSAIFSVKDGDSDDTNEHQDLSMAMTGNGDIQIDISEGSSSAIFSVKDGDSDDTNEHQNLSLTATGNGDIQIDISDGNSSAIFSVKDGDSDDTNEHQDLSMAVTGNGDIQIDISEGNSSAIFSVKDGDFDDTNEFQEIIFQANSLGFAIGLTDQDFLDSWDAPFHPEKDIDLIGNHGIKIQNNFGGDVVEIGTGTGSEGQITLTNPTSTSLNCGFGSDISSDDHGFIGVWGSGSNPQAGAFVDASGLGFTFATGTKNFRMDYPGKANKTIWYASVEGPEAGAYERGTATLQNGEVFVPFSDHFQLVIIEKGMTVMLTPLSGESQGLAVIEKTSTGFTVKELHKGTGNYSFDWEVKGVRAGFEDYKVIRDKSYGMPSMNIIETNK